MPDVTLAFVGDAYIQRADPDSAFAPVAPYLKNADIAFCNLETVIADKSYLDPSDHRTLPRTDESVLPHYIKAGFNVFNVANNPGMYHGLRAYLRSLDLLAAAGVAYAGGGRNITEARRPAIIERKGTKVAFVCRTSVGSVDGGATADRGGVARVRVHTSYEAPERVNEVPGSPPIIHTTAHAEDVAVLEEDIRSARDQADVVIVSWHWGVSPASRGDGSLAEYQIEMGRHALDVGADMVVGHHPHVLQPIEVYKGKPLVYSLANYVHDMQSFKPGRKLSTMLLRCLVRDGRIASLAYVPGLIEGNGPPRFLRPADAPHVVDYLQEISEPFGTRFEARGDEVSIVLENSAPRRVFTEQGLTRPEFLPWRRAAGL